MGAKIESEDEAEDGNAGGKGLVDPVPSYTLGEDSEEDGSEGEEEDDCDACGEGMDDAGPVAVGCEFFGLGALRLGVGGGRRKAVGSASGVDHVHLEDT